MLPQTPFKLDLAHLPTPLKPLDRLSNELNGPRIWLKCDDFTGSVVSGNKIRKLEYLMADALSKSSQVVLTCGGLQSNHCRATAAVSAQLGLKCHLLLRGPKGLTECDTAYDIKDLFPRGYEGNLLLDDLFGAKVSVFSPRYYGQNLEAIFERTSQSYAQQNLNSYSIPTGGSNGVGLWGYVQAAQELVNDFKTHNISPEHVVCASGSGGTQGGLTLGMYLLSVNTTVHSFAVCDSAQYFEDKILDDVDAWQNQFMPDKNDLSKQLQVYTNDQYIGPGYALGYEELYETIRKVARLEGVVLDPVYTGKAFYGMLKEIKKGKYSHCKDLVFVHTGGIFGVFPFSEAFNSSK